MLRVTFAASLVLTATHETCGGCHEIGVKTEAEIAQIEAASGLEPMVRYWMHTGFLNLRGEKMSKSLGNHIALEDPPREIRRVAVRRDVDEEGELLHAPSAFSTSAMIVCWALPKAYGW